MTHTHTQMDQLLSINGWIPLASTHGGVSPMSWDHIEPSLIENGTIHAARDQRTGIVAIVMFPYRGGQISVLAENILRVSRHGRLVNSVVEVYSRRDESVVVTTFVGPARRMKAIFAAAGHPLD